MKPRSLLGVALVLLGGCGLLPQAFRKPAIETPAALEGARSDTAGERDFALNSWREVFADQALQALLEEALQRGPDGLLAAARTREAAAALGLSRAQGLPNVAANLSTSPTPRRPGDDLTSSFLGGVAASWELDFWGRYARANDAARADLLASEINQQAVRASLVGNVANLYYQLAALRELENLTREAVATQQEALRLVQRKSAAGLASAAEERQQESVLASTEARLPPLRRQIVATRNALSMLLGRLPGSTSYEASLASEGLPATVPAGMPSALLERRPDVRLAEARLRAADARVEEARARFFPQIALTAVFGSVSTTLTDVLRGDGADVASLGPTMLLPLYGGGAVRGNRELALARLDQALINYRRTVHGAFADAADSLAAYESAVELVALQQRRERAASEALRLANLRFESGITTFLEVLEAQRQHLAADTEATQSLLEQRQALIRVYLALGGGWQEPAR